MLHFKKLFLFTIFLLSFSALNSLKQNLDLTEALRNEYHEYKKKFLKIRKTEGQETKRFWWIQGYFTITKEDTPILYNIVEDLAKKLELPVPEVYVFRSNVYYDINSYLSGADYKCNAWCSAWLTNKFKSYQYIAIGQDVIENLKYNEIKAIVAHELSHIKKKHILKNLIIGSTIRAMMFGALNCLSPFIPKYIIWSPIAPIKINIEPVTNYVASMPGLALSYKYEKEADLTAFNITKDHFSMISGLEKLELIFKKKHPFWYRISKFYESILPLNTHPRTKTRAEYLKKAAEKKDKEKKLKS